jgi:hypothetical protein
LLHPLTKRDCIFQSIYDLFLTVNADCIDEIEKKLSSIDCVNDDQVSAQGSRGQPEARRCWGDYHSGGDQDSMAM